MIFHNKNLICQPEEEIEGGPFHRDSFRVADDPVAGVLDSAIGLDVADDPITGILDGAVGLDMADDPVTGVLHRPVRLEVPYDSVAGILHGAIGFNVADDPVAVVLDGPVGLDMGHDPVAGVLHRLRGCSGRGEQQEEYERKHLFHALRPCKNQSEGRGALFFRRKCVSSYTDHTQGTITA